MENFDTSRPQYPLLLKLLIAIGMMFLGSLGILVVSLILSMLGFAYGIPEVGIVTLVLEQIGIVMLGLSILLGGVLSIVGLTMKSLTSSDQRAVAQQKQKNEDRVYDIRDYGLTVEDVLSDMSIQERELLAEKLAESRLAIREDGTLIPLEQAEKLYKIERFIDG